MTWYSYALSATIFFAASFLLIKKASIVGIPVNTLTLYIWLIAILLLALYMGFQGESFVLTGGQFLVIVFAGISTLLGVILLNSAIYKAPNPGYATAIASAQALIVIIASIFLFGSPFSFIKAFGALLTVIGVILLGA